MREDSVSGPEAERPPLPNLAVRIVQVFVSPAGLFDRLKENPAWLGALILIIAIGLAANAALPTEVIREAMLGRMPADVPPDAIEQQLRIANIMRFAGTVVVTPIFFAIVAGILLLIFNVFLGGEGRFKQLFSAVAHANFIVTLGGLLALPLILQKRDLTIAFSLGLLTPFLEREGWPFRFLNGLNVFGLWATVVLGIAVSRIYPRRSAGSAAAILLTLYVVAKAIAALFGGPRG